MRNTIYVKKVNESECLIDTTPSLLEGISKYMSVRATNYRWTPAYKMKKWDGFLRFFNLNTRLMPVGLLHRLKEYASKGNYNLEIDFQIEKRIDRNDFVLFVKSLNLPFIPRDYQLKAAYDALCYKHLNISSVTASGKSLMLYIIARWLEKNNKKTIIIVPNVSLVEQLYSDFIDYGWDEVEQYCSRIYAGKCKQLEKPIQIATWQSLYKDTKLFEVYDAIIFDECHLASAKSLKEICMASINAHYRIGVSGSYPLEGTAEWFTIVAGTGQIKTYSTYKTLQENNHIADIKIVAIKLDYPEQVKHYNRHTNDKNFAKETDFVNGIPERIDFIIKLAKYSQGNTLILFTKEAHGHPLYNLAKELCNEKTIIYMDGSTPAEQREEYRNLISTRDDLIIIASYGIFSTGINAPNIHNAIFASGYKSRTKILQSIGRVLRKCEGKPYALLFDIVDDLSFEIKEGRKVIDRYKNHALNHYSERSVLYESQKFVVENMSKNLNISSKYTIE